MKIRVFSAAEIFISSIIVLTLAFTLILSLAISNKNISRQRGLSQGLSCSKSLQSYLNNQLVKNNKFYSASENEGKIFIQKISSTEATEAHQGVAILNQNDQSLYVFIKGKRPAGSQYSYFYYRYNLNDSSEISDGEVNLEKIAVLKNKSDILDKACQSENNSANLKPFALRTINQLDSVKNAIEVILNDRVGATKGNVWSIINWRQSSEFF